MEVVHQGRDFPKGKKGPLCPGLLWGEKIEEIRKRILRLVQWKHGTQAGRSQVAQHTYINSFNPSNNAKKIEEHKSSYSVPPIKIKFKDQYTQEALS